MRAKDSVLSLRAATLMASGMRRLWTAFQHKKHANINYLFYSTQKLLHLSAEPELQRFSVCATELLKAPWIRGQLMRRFIVWAIQLRRTKVGNTKERQCTERNETRERERESKSKLKTWYTYQHSYNNICQIVFHYITVSRDADVY